MELRGTRSLVMGLGVHGGGVGVARFLASQGAIVTVTDLRPPEQLAPSLAALEGLPIRYVLGEHRPEDFATAELVVRNPGVPHSSPFLAIARAAGAAIEMEMSLFFRLCPGPILGVTGTKGKTTTTMLLGAMLAAQHPDTVVAGNLRVSALEALPRITPATPVVLELSSFALEGLGAAGLSPRYALITNIAPDHLDRYGSMSEYIAAKTQIWRHQASGDTLALPWGDATMASMAAEARADVVWFAGELPRQRGGAPVAGWRDGRLLWASDGETLLCERGDVRLPGSHNLANVAAAAALALRFGISPERIRAAVREFGGVAHRLETLAVIDGVTFVNDSAATVPEAALAALASFDAPIVLIAGGADKQLAFDRLARAIVGRARAVVLLQGSATPGLQEALRAALADRGGPAPQIDGPYEDVGRAVRAAQRLARPGDVVLLSPGCASFGMFRNEFHRGDEFRRIVGELQRERQDGAMLRSTDE
jgi:UDP-N-acetylmuramoylalanine--D-glutamate ligase